MVLSDTLTFSLFLSFCLARVTAMASVPGPSPGQETKVINHRADEPGLCSGGEGRTGLGCACCGKLLLLLRRPPKELKWMHI